MKIETSRFGALEIDDSSIITMPRGPLGFEDRTRFVTIQHRTDTLFRWLQCVDDAELAFVVVDPSLFFTDYDIEISDSEVEKLQLQNEEDAFVLTFVTIGEGGRQITTNLAAPIVINSKSMTGLQVILQDNRYLTKHQLVVAQKNEAETKIVVKAA